MSTLRLPKCFVFVTQFKGKRFEAKVYAAGPGAAKKKLKLHKGERVVAGPHRCG